MRKFLASRIFGLAFLYCAVFCVLVIVQFSSKGNFSLQTDLMTIRGRYYQTEESPGSEKQSLTGGVKIFFGGLEFNLREERGKGLTLIDNDGASIAVNPEYMAASENTTRFGLPGGTAITFSPLDSSRGLELQINADFADNISQIIIPITPRRSSTIRDSGQIGISYSGSRYFFNSPGQEFEDGKLTLSRQIPLASYRTRGRQQAFDPANFIIAQAHNYDSAIMNWRNTIFAQLNQNATSLQNENDITAYLSEAARNGNLTAAAAFISGDFRNSSRRTFFSSAYLGGMTQSYRTFVLAENEKTNLITNLAREKSIEILKEEHVLDYLFIRSNISLANDILDIINNLDPQAVTIDICAGLLEAYQDIKRWRPQIVNPVNSFTESIITLVSEALSKENDLVFVPNAKGQEIAYSLRLGKSLAYWASETNNKEWADIGHSLVLSAINSGTASGIGNLYGILRPGDYYPRAAWLTDNGLWAWTVSPSIRASYPDGNLNLSFTFPVGMTHHVLIRGVRPFIKIQFHEMDWRTDSQFERYDSSGWVYYPQDQILVIKLRHRLTTESVKIVYVPEAPPPPPPSAGESGAASSGADTQAAAED